MVGWYFLPCVAGGVFFAMHILFSTRPGLPRIFVFQAASALHFVFCFFFALFTFELFLLPCTVRAFVFGVADRKGNNLVTPPISCVNVIIYFILPYTSTDCTTSQPGQSVSPRSPPHHLVTSCRSAQNDQRNFTQHHPATQDTTRPSSR